MNLHDLTLFDWSRDRAKAGSRQLCVLGMPSDGGNPIHKGTAQAPASIRRASLGLPRPKILGFDFGDMPAVRMYDSATALNRLSAQTAEISDAGHCPLILGGDHAITYGPVKALQRDADLCVVWFDAHTDFSPLREDQHHDHKQVLRRIASLPRVVRVVVLGHRGITPEDERKLGARITVVPSVDAAAGSYDCATILALIPPDMRCYLSIDIDAIDPFCAPGTGSPVPEGLAPEVIERILAAIVAQRKVVGIDLVEINPRLDIDDATSIIGARLLHCIAEHWPEADVNAY